VGSIQTTLRKYEKAIKMARLYSVFIQTEKDAAERKTFQRLQSKWDKQVNSLKPRLKRKNRPKSG